MKIALILGVITLGILSVSCQGGGDHHHHIFDYYSKPHYHYKYGVHDPKHHDFHDQWEKREGEKVTGHYSLKQPDGRTREVEYEADKHGINYKVRYHGHAIHEQGHKHHGEGGGGGGGGHGHGHGHGESYIEANLHAPHHEKARVIEHHHHH